MNSRPKNVHEIESQFIMEKEQEILNKAKSVGQELQSIRMQKIDLLCQVFKEQLDKDMDGDVRDYNHKLEQELSQQVIQVEQVKKEKVFEFDQLINNIQEQVKTFQMIIEDLKDKKDEVEGAQVAAQEYLKKQKQTSLEDYKQKCGRVINIKVKEFRNQVSQGKL